MKDNNHRKTREEIMKQAESPYTKNVEWAILNVLLDLRDLLEQKLKGK